LPSPAEWVTVRRTRVKDAVDPVWWLSKTPDPKASNWRVLRPYSDSMKKLLENGYKAQLRPSGHDISEHFSKDNQGAIPPNLLSMANTDSNSTYLRECRQRGIKPHPARFPHGLPEFFIRFLTDPGDLVLDPFAGSNVTGEVAERLGRRWLAFELVEEYLEASKFRFPALYEQLPLLETEVQGRTAEKVSVGVYAPISEAVAQMALLESKVPYQPPNGEEEACAVTAFDNPDRS
jgi:site-specific DNA-methyltransferase (cytosine-N4-specific)